MLKRDMIILFAINDRTTYGLEIMKRLEKCDPENKISVGVLYTLLKSLESRGLILSYLDPEGSSKRYYQTTFEGKECINNILNIQKSLLYD